MPTYPFVCLDCTRRFEQFLTFQEYDQKKAKCPHCGSRSVRRRMTRVRLLRSDESRADSLGSDLDGMGALADDPRAMGQALRRMGQELGEDLPPEFDEVTGRLEQGEDPETIAGSLPDMEG